MVLARAPLFMFIVCERPSSLLNVDMFNITYFFEEKEKGRKEGKEGGRK